MNSHCLACTQIDLFVSPCRDCREANRQAYEEAKKKSRTEHVLLLQIYQRVGADRTLFNEGLKQLNVPSPPLEWIPLSEEEAAWSVI